MATPAPALDAAGAAANAAAAAAIAPSPSPDVAAVPVAVPVPLVPIASPIASPAVVPGTAAGVVDPVASPSPAAPIAPSATASVDPAASTPSPTVSTPPSVATTSPAVADTSAVASPTAPPTASSSTMWVWGGSATPVSSSTVGVGALPTPDPSAAIVAPGGAAASSGSSSGSSAKAGSNGVNKTTTSTTHTTISSGDSKSSGSTKVVVGVTMSIAAFFLVFGFTLYIRHRSRQRRKPSVWMLPDGLRSFRNGGNGPGARPAHNAPAHHGFRSIERSGAAAPSAPQPAYLHPSSAQQQAAISTVSTHNQQRPPYASYRNSMGAVVHVPVTFTSERVDDYAGQQHQQHRVLPQQLQPQQLQPQPSDKSASTSFLHSLLPSAWSRDNSTAADMTDVGERTASTLESFGNLGFHGGPVVAMEAGYMCASSGGSAAAALSHEKSSPIAVAAVGVGAAASGAWERTPGSLDRTLESIPEECEGEYEVEEGFRAYASTERPYHCAAPAIAERQAIDPAYYAASQQYPTMTITEHVYPYPTNGVEYASPAPAAGDASLEREHRRMTDASDASYGRGMDPEMRVRWDRAWAEAQ